MRRVNIPGGNLTLQDYCTAGPQYASGGFIADSQTGFIINGSQQQFLVRNSSIGGWSNGVWNQVFSGVEGAPPLSFSTTPYNPPPYTTLATSPVTREEPFLYVDSAGSWRVFVPAVRRDAATDRVQGGGGPGELGLPVRREERVRVRDGRGDGRLAVAALGLRPDAGRGLRVRGRDDRGGCQLEPVPTRAAGCRSRQANPSSLHTVPALSGPAKDATGSRAPAYPPSRCRHRPPARSDEP